ncbi:MAG: MFS transporter [Candidatus Promineifilaceae bacterium]|nr:MFS transporter [Candidatus Promineifilaceae bacterium]
MNVQSRTIVRSYLVLTGLYTLSASLIWGVNTLFLLDAGLSIAQVFFANAIFTGAMALFEIPTGVLADTRGRRVSFLLSIAVLVVGTLGYVAAAQFGGGLWLFGFMSIILGLGYTFYSGAMEAWLVDALNASGFHGELDDIFARGWMITAVGMLIGSVSGGFLGSIDLSLPFLVRAGLLVLVFIVAFFTMHEIGFTPSKATTAELPAEMRKIARASIQYGWQQPSVRLLLVTSFIQAIFYAWGFYAWQPYFLELLGRDAPWVAGVVAALVALATMAGNKFVQWRSHKAGRRTSLLLGAAIVGTLAAVAVGLVNSFWIAVTCYLIASLSMGVWKPVKQAYMHQLIPSAQRATVVSFDSLVDSAGSVVGQVGLGQLAETRSIASGYVIGGLLTALAWPVVLRLRRRQDPEDFIVGDAGKDGACSAQGLPSVSCIDSQAGVAVTSD